MSPLVKNLKSELEELEGRITRLRRFISYNPQYLSQEEESRALMRAQLPAMETYRDILERRLLRTGDLL